LLRGGEARAEIPDIHGAEVEDFLQHIHFRGGNAGGGACGLSQLGKTPRGGTDQSGAFIQVLVAQVQSSVAAGSGGRGRRGRRQGSVDRHGHERTMEEQDAKLKLNPMKRVFRGR
jgi:hypothetical protein